MFPARLCLTSRFHEEVYAAWCKIYQRCVFSVVGHVNIREPNLGPRANNMSAYSNKFFAVGIAIGSLLGSDQRSRFEFSTTSSEGNPKF